jgi:hypothetical protein
VEVVPALTICLDIETVAPAGLADACEEMAGERMDAAQFGALCPPLATIVCVCLARLNADDEIASEWAGVVETRADRARPNAYDTEAALLTAVSGLIQRADRLVTFNGAGFDIPTLLFRSLAHGIPAATLLRAHQEYRYKPDLNYDLREQFTNFGRFRDGSLRAFALGFGLPDPKADGDGSHVADLFASGDTAALARYCQGDVRTTAALYHRWRSFTGQRRVAA